MFRYAVAVVLIVSSISIAQDNSDKSKQPNSSERTSDTPKLDPNDVKPATIGDIKRVLVPDLEKISEAFQKVAARMSSLETTQADLQTRIGAIERRLGISSTNIAGKNPTDAPATLDDVRTLLAQQDRRINQLQIDVDRIERNRQSESRYPTPAPAGTSALVLMNNSPFWVMQVTVNGMVYSVMPNSSQSIPLVPGSNVNYRVHTESFFRNWDSVAGWNKVVMMQ